MADQTKLAAVLGGLALAGIVGYTFLQKNPRPQKSRAPGEKIDINKVLGEYLPQVDGILQKYIPRKYTEADVTAIAGKPSYQNDPVTLTKCITEPIWNILDRGGKRWRCALVFLIAEVFEQPASTVVDFIPITEIIHNGTLVIDDIEDDSEFRRGKPCLHLVYRPDVAINVGNAMYFLPLTILANKRGKISDKILLDCYDLCIAEMAKLHYGQGLDIWWHASGNKPDQKSYSIMKSAKENEADPTVDQYLQMCAYKTGTLARMSAKLSALICKASHRQVEAIGRFAEAIGVAFQIQDDILNIASEKFQEGKGVGEDIHEGKRTLMVLHTFENAPKEKAQRLREILNAHPPMNDKSIIEAIDIIKQTGSIEYAQKKAKEIVTSAWEEIERVLPDNEGRQKLKAFADYLIERDI